MSLRACFCSFLVVVVVVVFTKNNSMNNLLSSVVLVVLLVVVRGEGTTWSCVYELGGYKYDLTSENNGVEG